MLIVRWIWSINLDIHDCFTLKEAFEPTSSTLALLFFIDSLYYDNI